MKYLSIFIRVALLALGQSLDCHSASEVSLMDMGKISQCITTTRHSKAKTLCIFLGIYCKWNGTHYCTMVFQEIISNFPISDMAVRHQGIDVIVMGTICEDRRIIITSAFVTSCKKQIMYVLSLRSVYALTRFFFSILHAVINNCR